MSCRAPGPALNLLIEPWPAGQMIHVIHDAAFAPESFNPGVDAAGMLRNPTRFAPIRDSGGKIVPYLYGGSSLDCAIFETVFHNVPIDAPDKYVDLDDFFGRSAWPPAMRQQLVDARCRMAVDAPEHVAQVGPRIDVVELD